MKAESIFPIYLAGEKVTTHKTIQVLNPYTQEPAFQVHQATEKELEIALEAAKNSFAQTRELPSWQKYEILQKIGEGLKARKEALAEVISAEAGKPIAFAKGEVDRAIITFSLAADWVRNWKGEVLPLDLAEKHNGRMGIIKHFPIGPLLAISPFNFPLNLVAHKVAPAIATGCPIILKPASQTPVTALLLAEIIAETDWPKTALSVVPCPGKMAQTLVEDDRIAKLSFTGSPAVGWALKAAAGKKRVTLELGGDAAAIIDQSADLKVAAEKCAFGAFAFSGQICISVQRILVHEAVYSKFKTAFLDAVSKIKAGDPGLEDTIVGPMIDLDNQKRIKKWIAEATTGGANLLAGTGRAENNIVEPVVLERVPAGCRLAHDEAFAPVVYLQKVSDMETAFHIANDSKFGLQAGIFTDSQTTMKKAFHQLNVGGVVINDVPTTRVDNMPYGGIKESGFGREGLEYAIKEMLEPKVMVW